MGKTTTEWGVGDNTPSVCRSYYRPEAEGGILLGDEKESYIRENGLNSIIVGPPTVSRRNLTREKKPQKKKNTGIFSIGSRRGCF